MFADQGRDALRAAYREAWRKWRERLPLQALEAQIAEVIAEHPEYHALLASDDALLQDFPVRAGSENPFLHWGCTWRCASSSLPTDRSASAPLAAVWRRGWRPGTRPGI